MRRREPRRSSYHWMLWGTLLVILILGYLNHHPIRLSSKVPVVRGSTSFSDIQSDVLVVVWTDEITRSAEGGRFDEVDWSWVWVDVLQAEVGPVRVIEAETLVDHSLEGVRFIVITHSAAVHPQVMDAAHLLERYVNHGGVLVLERPEGSLRSAFSADGRGGTRTPVAITQVAGVADELAQALQQMPLFTRFVGSTGPLEGAQTYLAMDGAPVVYRISRADGAALTVDFNFPLALISLRQGRPSDIAFTVQARDPAQGPLVSDLVADPQLLQASEPYADLLAHFMVQVALADQAPLPGFWYFPRGASGVLLLSHNSGDQRERTTWLARYENSQGATSTLFFSYRALPGLEEMEPLDQELAEPALLWERGAGQAYQNRRRIGLGGLRPFYREISLSEHGARLARSQSGAWEVLGVRIRDGRWSSHYSEVFQVMAAAGVGYDSTFGPTPADRTAAPAYRYGTGRPFPVHDTNGLPLSLHEVPLVLDGIADAQQMESLETLIRQSQRHFHQAIGVNIDSDFLVHEGALDTYDHWQNLIELAGRCNHLVMSTGALVHFLKERSITGLQSQFVIRPASGEQGTMELVLSMEVAVTADGFWMRIPRRIGERRLRGVMDATPLADPSSTVEELATRNEEVFGQEVALFPVSPEVRRIEAVYR